MSSLFFFCVIAANSSVLIRLKTTRSAIASQAAFRVLCIMVSLGESKILCRNNDTSSSISKTCLIFPGVGGICPEKNRVWMGVLRLGKVSLFVLVLANNFRNTARGLYGISPVARLYVLSKNTSSSCFLYQRNKICFVDIIGYKPSFFS